MPINWDLSVSEAKQDQQRVKAGLVHQPLQLSDLPYALAVGVAYSEGAGEAVAVCTSMLISGSQIDPDSYMVSRALSDFPYVAGFFVYREGPAICELLDSLPGLPRLIVFDSQGVAHPRGLGLAAHIGVLYDVPTIGITRKLLSGRASPVPSRDGATAPIKGRSGSEIGIAVRFKGRCEPVYCSPGHRTDLATIKSYCQGVRAVRSCFPEALALVHQKANILAREPR
ncbi:endonuclease V [Kibdelosporangium phytohabitans]|uniref:endonuclease V n=1 Tax=Kibdelosporangium phytohabitans TaxID=860235 RepID=UPI001CEF0E22